MASDFIFVVRAECHLTLSVFLMPPIYAKLQRELLQRSGAMQSRTS